MKHVDIAPSKTIAVPKSVETQPVPSPAIDINQLFRKHHTHLLRFVQRYVRSTEDAEDVIQNTFVEALRCADRFSGLSKPSTWLFGIALNLARNQVRRNCANMIEEVDEDFMEEIVDIYADPADIVEKREILDKISMLMQSMPNKINQTFEAVMHEHASYEEAAQKLDVPVGTIRSRISRIRTSLRVELASSL